MTLALQTIAHALNGKIVGGWVRAPGPGHSRHDDSLAVRPDADAPLGLTFHSFANDAPRDVIAHLRDAALLKEQPRETPRTIARPQRKAIEQPTRREDAQRLWAKSAPADGTLAQTYLRARGYLGPIPNTIRFIAAGAVSAHPTLIAACGDVEQGEDGDLDIKGCDVRAVIRIALSHDGRRKAAIETPKKSLGPMKERPCWVRAINDGLCLAITEGVEDALSLAWPLGVGAWACGGGSNFRNIAQLIPPYVECVLLGEDQNDTGRRGCDEAEHIIRSRTDWLAGRPPAIRRVKTWEGGAA